MSRFSKIAISRPGGALVKYLEEISDAGSPLSRDEEGRLSERIQQGDQEALNTLVQANLRFVIKVAKEYANWRMPLEDLISEGNVGLIEEDKRFDGERGFKFISYAVWWIRQTILVALADQSYPIRMPLNQAALLSKIHRVAAALRQKLERNPDPAEIAEEMGASYEKIVEAIQKGRSSRSLEEPYYSDDNERLTFASIISNDSPPPDKEAVEDSSRSEIAWALSTLDPREAEVIRLYYGLDKEMPLNLGQIGEKYGLTRERIRQIKAKGLQRLRHHSRSRRLRRLLPEEE